MGEDLARPDDFQREREEGRGDQGGGTRWHRHGDMGLLCAGTEGWWLQGMRGCGMIPLDGRQHFHLWIHSAAGSWELGGGHCCHPSPAGSLEAAHKVSPKEPRQGLSWA